METRLTIAIPVYNRSAHVREAIESALNQTIPVPILIVDNASTEFDFKALAESYCDNRICYVRNERNVGMAGNWNRCLELCATPYVSIVHDDDKVMPDFSIMMDDPMSQDATIIFSRNNVIDQDGNILRETSIKDYRRFKELRDWCVFNPFQTGIVVRRETALELGGFKESLRFTPDLDMWVRLGLVGRYFLVEGLLGSYRMYISAQRESTKLEANMDHTPLMSIQIKRNIARYKARFPQLPPPVRKPSFIGFSALIHYWGTLSRRRALYALAIYVNSDSPSFLGRVVRCVMRIAGRPLCSLAVLLSRATARPSHSRSHC